METIRKHIGEGFGKGELYAALAYDSGDAFGGMAIKAIRLNPPSGSTAITIGDSTTAITLATYAQRAISIYTTCASADGSNMVLPVYINATMSGTGGIGRALEAKLTVSGKLGYAGNAIKGYTDVTLTSLATTGLISAICAELKLPSAILAGGVYAVLELNWVGQANTNTMGALTGAHTTLIYANVGGGDATDFDARGYILEIEGMSDSDGNAWYDNTLRIAIGDTAWYLPMSSAQGSFTTAYPIVTTYATTAVTIGACTTGIAITNASTYAIQIITDGKVVLGTTSIGIPLADSEHALAVHSEPGSAFTAYTSSFGIRSRYHISTAQTNIVTFEAVDARLRIKANIAGGIHAGVQGYVEISDSPTLTTGQTFAGGFTVEAGTGTVLTSGYLYGVHIDSATADTVDVSNVSYTALRISTGTSEKEMWTYGIYMGDDDAVTGIQIGDCTTGITLSGTYTNAISIVNAVGTTSGSTGILIADTYTQLSAGSHKAINASTTYTPASAGAATPIAIVGKVSIDGAMSGGLAWGLQGQLDFTNNANVTGGTAGAIRAVITASATPTFTGMNICGLYIDNLVAYDMTSSSGAISLIHMGNHGGSYMDNAMYIHGRDITYLFELHDCEVGGFQATANGVSFSGNQKSLKINIDGTDHYLIASVALA